MNVVKAIIAVVWPIIYRVLIQAADKTDTQLDDIAVEAANTAVLEWLNNEEELEVRFE